VTTHAESGGTGIGFMSTFEIMSDCRASLIISEKAPPGEGIYTKSVTVRFDRRYDYKVESYRAEQIKMLNRKKRDIDLVSA